MIFGWDMKVSGRFLGYKDDRDEYRCDPELENTFWAVLHMPGRLSPAGRGAERVFSRGPRGGWIRVFCFLHNFFVITPFSPIFAATSSYFRPLSHHPIISSFIIHVFSLKLNHSSAVSPVCLILQDLACNFSILAHITCHSSFSDKYLTPDKSTHNTH